MALGGIFEDPVLHAIQLVARLEHRRVQNRVLGGRDVAGPVLVHDLRAPDLRALEVRGVDRRRPGDDSVVVRRVALRLCQRLTASRRTSVPIGIFRIRAISSMDDRLGRDRHLMHRPIRKIDHFLGVSGNKRRRIAAGVARVRAGGRVSCRERGPHGGITDGPGPGPVADRLQVSVPAGFGQPDLDLDLGIADRRECRRYAAERRQILERRPLLAFPAPAPRWRKRSGRDWLRHGNRRVLQLQRS